MQPNNALGRSAVLHEYARLAGDYDLRWSFYIRATVRETTARLPVQTVYTALDIGCGTGAMLAQLFALFPSAELYGLDACSEMLEVADRRLPAAIELQQGWAEELPYADGQFDMVTSCNMFHFIRRPDAALSEMLRVLRPGGTLVITDWCDDYLACKLCDWYLRWLGSRLRERSHFRTYTARQFRRMLEEAHAQDIAIEKYKINWLWGLMTAIVQKSAEGEPSLDTVSN